MTMSKGKDRHLERTDIQDSIVQAVRESGVTQTLLAERTGHRRSYINSVLNGQYRGSMTFWQDVLNAIEATVVVRSKSNSAPDLPAYTLATVGHPANKRVVIKTAEGYWRTVHDGKPVDDEDFRAGWNLL